MEEQKLQEMYQMVQDNNRMLRAMRRTAFIGSIVKVVWWVFILLILPYITWLFLQPYLGGALETYQGLQSQGSTVNANLSGLEDLLKQFGGGAGQ
ncbi:hypothetical protein A2841_02260 [Candidatus Kaiserbacteria bacterium RIFCSPHIGHO2_01_FULL_48_10]|uniref:Uncharacterized protein n=1 Tax=Candidatus Kaiserbacteria bacterium RIFCSPHIGHO2_01_FULL_48_10 TaxID=1798476 RepID=A0A1F6C568_9BACT|nr:MAG: hypothetical protein A2841_02260 [Candidatus Kaiserbacteria bacterium RIFCSPHIGHO2_01_FULL_48_10]